MTPPRYWPLGAGRKVTSPFGPRSGGFHYGTDFGRDGGSANMPVYAVADGTVIHAGAAQGYGGPDPAGWLVVDHPADAGGGCSEYGHIIREVARGDRVRAGQRIGRINPDSRTNGGTAQNPIAPHLHLSVMPHAYNPATKIDPIPWLGAALEPGDHRPPTTPPEQPKTPPILADPFTGAVWSPNRHRRSKGTPRWIVVHTQEGGRTARGLAGFLANPASKVSYHSVNDEHEVLKVVAETDAPWAAAGANEYAFHHCFAGSYAGWSRNKWLETDATDGKNEDVQLTRGAHVIAWWSHKYRIPAEWIGGRNVPPWGHDGICGHIDLGRWGGGHTDPGPNFPVDELLRRVRQFLTGVAQPPIPKPPPIGVPGTNPDHYAGVLLYRGRPGNNPDQVRAVQRRLKAAYRAYAGHLAVDGDFGTQTEAAVREFQRRSGLVDDGIVGPMTAAALKAW
ncbi:Glycyl-glycine endopeptidase ALE-1 [Mycolicibacterium vanbaalenii]|uniref:Glycyl-glycine endopeptidase ALE-1 n=1 Tax=Mycolicibacterium vanbaalenii TaxID=110539 RepID=A0A5S9MQJ6_MYCVN|nr:peptidoglycan-binding protein [Mycolicibacterium vanbaalenii]CAA0078361.1 Glycyl-glycine endopeptidase ALE-1 [Mycolicibacterium vanbaalenii]